MSLFAVHLGGRLIVTERLRQQLKGARHIAADSGIVHCETLGIIPELWVGDFDSTGVWLSELFSAVERLEFPSAKARTDGELAVDAALARGATSIALVGGFGGKRTDHALSNLMHMLALGEAGNEAMMTSGDEEAWPVAPRRRDFDLPHGTIFSVIALEDLKGLSLKGVRWPLDNVNVDFGSSLTVSNEVTGTLHVSVKTGRAAIVARISGL